MLHAASDRRAQHNSKLWFACEFKLAINWWACAEMRISHIIIFCRQTLLRLFLSIENLLICLKWNTRTFDVQWIGMADYGMVCHCWDQSLSPIDSGHLFVSCCMYSDMKSVCEISRQLTESLAIYGCGWNYLRCESMCSAQWYRCSVYLYYIHVSLVGFSRLLCATAKPHTCTHKWSMIRH